MWELILEGWGPIPKGAILGFGLALVVSSAGFARVVYFISTGYAFSITVLAAMAAWLYWGSIEPLVAAQLVLLAIYGLRLGGYLLGRERSPSYRRELDDVQARAAGITRPIQVAIWVTVSLLYVVMFYPALTNLAARAAGDTRLGTLPLGLVVMGIGLGIEAWADRQKSRYKAENPTRFCGVGLYRIVRCPNYFGEMVFWLGQFMAGVGHFTHWSHWVLSAIGLVSIQLIMVGSTRRLELKQDARYGDREDYRTYVRTVPVLFPFVPVFSLKNAKLYLG